MKLAFLKEINKQKLLSGLLFMLFALVIILGGIGGLENVARTVGLIVGVIFLLASFIIKRKIAFPKGFIFFVLFLGIAIIRFFATENPQSYLLYFLHFIGGGTILACFL